jgi:hypothetical protein
MRMTGILYAHLPSLFFKYDKTVIITFPYFTSVNSYQGRDGLARAADRARVLLSFIASCGHPR